MILTLIVSFQLSGRAGYLRVQFHRRWADPDRQRVVRRKGQTPKMKTLQFAITGFSRLCWPLAIALTIAAGLEAPAPAPEPADAAGGQHFPRRRAEMADREEA
jgi:hypothetical protein